MLITIFHAAFFYGLQRGELLFGLFRVMFVFVPRECTQQPKIICMRHDSLNVKSLYLLFESAEFTMTSSCCCCCWMLWLLVAGGEGGGELLDTFRILSSRSKLSAYVIVTLGGKLPLVVVLLLPLLFLSLGSSLWHGFSPPVSTT